MVLQQLVLNTYIRKDLDFFMAADKQQVEQQLWNIANTLRGKMDADDFRDYILGIIFYKYLSEKMEDYVDTILSPDNIRCADIESHKGCLQSHL